MDTASLRMRSTPGSRFRRGRCLDPVPGAPGRAAFAAVFLWFAPLMVAPLFRGLDILDDPVRGPEPGKGFPGRAPPAIPDGGRGLGGLS